MKKRLPVSLSVLMALLLVAFGVLYGTAAGYREERDEALSLFAAENGLRDVLHYRAADGLNLCVVARRHLGDEDGQVLLLEQAARRLQSADDPESCFREDGEMDDLIRQVHTEVLKTRSIQASERDQRYLDMLENDLNGLSSSAAAAVYNEAAQRYNERLKAPLFGPLAQMLGMRILPQYGGSEWR